MILKYLKVIAEAEAGTTIDTAVDEAIDFCNEYNTEMLLKFNSIELHIDAHSNNTEKVNEYYRKMEEKR